MEIRFSGFYRAEEKLKKLTDQIMRYIVEILITISKFVFISLGSVLKIVMVRIAIPFAP